MKISLNVFVFIDKTNNIYKFSKCHHKELLHDNVTKTYQKAPPILEASTNLQAKIISTKLKDSYRVKHIVRTFAFVAFKDRKDNFHSNPRVVK